MRAQPSFERCKAFIDSQLHSDSKALAAVGLGEQWRAVTISRLAGAGAHEVGEALAQHLQAHSPKNAPPWTQFDRNLVERVLRDHQLPERMARFMTEDRISELHDTVDELFGLHPPSWTLVRQTADTILKLVELGRVIIVGRGGGIITRGLDYVFHVRLVGSLERRIQHVEEYYKLSRKEAAAFVEREDRGRRRFLRKYFQLDIDDPLLYHVVINTDLVSYRQAGQMIGDALLGRP
ncbi:MAG TPA: cytidylate kinase-like family protein [Candidatus Acidoferrum sp.]|nr:cytidylate kinase-like family protein [Candidatus Acidoferrum sp.]